MSEFNGKKFYGYSLYNDPALTTTTRNFEFQYNRPEQLDRVIEQVQSNENPLAKQRKSSMLARYSNLKKIVKPEKEISTPFQSKDVDVETQLSTTNQDTSKMRVLTANEIDSLISKAKSKMDNTKIITNDKTNTLERDEKNNNCDVNAKPQVIDSHGGLLETFIVEELREEQPKWVEIIEKPTTVPAFYEDIVQSTDMVSPPLLDNTTPVEWSIQECPIDLNQNIDTSPYDPIANLMQYECNEYAANQIYYEIVDSDLEHEMHNRSEYTKYISHRPDEGKLVNLSDDQDGYAQFVEVESVETGSGLSFLKNTVPMRYTDLTDELPENAGSQDEIPQMKIVIKNITTDEGQGDKKSKQSVATVEVETKSKEPKKKKTHTLKKKETSSQRIKQSKVAKEQVLSSAPNSARLSGKAVQEQAESAPKIAKQYSSYSYSSAASSRVSTPRSKQKRNIPTKSIAELKMEKMAIYSNMSITQERIIDTLDKLRYTLLEIHIPESSFEATKRQKNAFEFSVRFSRNYLFPLKGMIEDLKATTIAQINSALTNEASARVSSIYSLVLQSLHTYQKQLRYFILDQVPQKLTSLIELMQLATNVCLEKGIFDPNDTTVDCLKDRCSKFLGFLEDIHEQRFLTAQTNYKQLNYDKLQPPKYDLKMFMNNLNMYEPKLVPKKSNRRSNGSKSGKNNADIDADEYSDIAYTKRTDADEGISTHVQHTKLRDSSGLLNDWQSLISKSTNTFLASNQTSEQFVSSGLNKAIVDALQTVTKEQVRQVMQPIIQSLGTALDMKKNSEMIEAILNAFNTKLICTVQDDDNKNYNEPDTKSKVVGVKEYTNEAGNENHHINSVEQQQTSASKSSKATKQTKQLTQRTNRKAGKTPTPTLTPPPLLLQPPPPPSQQRRDREVYDDAVLYVDGKTSVCGEVDIDEDDVNSESVIDGVVGNNARYHNIYAAAAAVYGCGGNNDGHELTIANDRNQCKTRVDICELNNDQVTKNYSESYEEEAEVDEEEYYSDHFRGVSVVNAKHKTEQSMQLNDQQQQQSQQQEHKLQKHPKSHYKSRQQKNALNKAVAAKKNTRTNQLSVPVVAIPGGATNKKPTSSNASINRTLYKKRRSLLQPPPPAPAGTPTTSARSFKKSNIVDIFETVETISTNENVNALESLSQQQMNGRIHKRKSIKTPLNVGKTLPEMALDRNQCYTWDHKLCDNTNVPLTYNFNSCIESTQHMLQNVRERSYRNDQQHQQHQQHYNMNSTNLVNSVNKDSENNSKRSQRNYNCTNPDASLVTNFVKDLKPNSINMQVHSARSVSVANLSNGKNINVTKKRRERKTIKNDERQVCDCGMQDIEKCNKPECMKHLQLQKLKVLQHEMNQQERKQNEQMRTLDKLNNVTQLYATTDTQKANLNAPNTNNVENMLRERNKFIESCRQNRFYANPNYDEPWRIFTILSEKLANEIVGTMEEDFATGVMKFVQDFLELETKT